MRGKIGSTFLSIPPGAPSDAHRKKRCWCLKICGASPLFCSGALSWEGGQTCWLPFFLHTAHNKPLLQDFGFLGGRLGV